MCSVLNRPHTKIVTCSGRGECGKLGMSLMGKMYFLLVERSELDENKAPV